MDEMPDKMSDPFLRQKRDHSEVNNPASIESPPNGTPALNVRSALRYGAALLFLLLLLAGARSLSFDTIHSQVAQVSQSVEAGGDTVISTIVRGAEICWEELSMLLEPVGSTIAERWSEFAQKEKNNLAKQKTRWLSGWNSTVVAIKQIGDVAGGWKQWGQERFQAAALATGYGMRFVVARVSVRSEQAWENRLALRPFVALPVEFSKNLGQTVASFWGGSMDGMEVAWRGVRSVAVLAGDSLAAGYDQVESTLRLVGYQAKILPITIARSVDNYLPEWKADTSSDTPNPVLTVVSPAELEDTPDLPEEASEPLGVVATSSEETASLAVGWGKASGYWVSYLADNIVTGAVIDYWQSTAAWRSPVHNVFAALARGGSGIKSNISFAWSSFFGELRSIAKTQTANQSATTNASSGDDVTLRDTNSSDMFNDTGIVLMKPSGSTTIDMENVKKLRDSFSDRVIVDFSDDGQTGIVKPILKDKVGAPFIFVITPVQQ